MGKVENDDLITFLVKYENGAIGDFSSSRVATGRKNYFYYEIQGTEGSVVYDLERMCEVQVYFKADAAKDIESIKDMTFAVESGSAGEAAAQAAGLNATAVQSQADALMEVAAGTSDACVIDLLMAGAMIGEGTSYPNLTYTVNLNEANGEEDENYVVGFRKGSDLTEAFNDFYKAAYKDGVVLSFAQKYGVQEAIVDPEA